MDQQNNNKNVWNRRLILRILSGILIIFGCFIIIINLASFAKGYFAFLTPSEYEKSNTEDEDTITQTKETPETLGDLNSKENEVGSKEELYTIRPKTGDKMGELYIPKLDVSLPIYEGTDEDELEKGVGHFADSVLPGEADNCVLSGHRDTVFRKLGDIGEGDSLVVTTSAGEFEYKVKKVRIVESDDKTVIVPKPAATLTVSTCYPFDYIGPAPQRYILVAYLASKILNE